MEGLAEELAVDFGDAEGIPKLKTQLAVGGSRTSAFDIIFHFNRYCLHRPDLYRQWRLN